MKALVAATLIVVAAAAGAQSYDQRAQAERTAEQLQAIDKANMEKARAAAAPKGEKGESIAPSPMTLVIGLLVAFGVGVLVLRKR